jgi:hypothetical protein
VLSNRAYLTAYVGVWFLLTWLFVVVVHTSGGVGLREVSVLLAPMMVLYALIGLSAWYICKATPVHSTRDLRVFVTHLTAGFVLSFLWMHAGLLYARLLWRNASFQRIEELYAGHQTVLLLDGVLLYLLNAGFFYVVIALEASREVERRAAQSVALARDAELRALRAQINPHFLFNSLNSISALTSIDAGRAREMCLLLADFLRLTLGMGERNVIPLSEELDLLEKFMAIEKVRFGARLNMRENVQERAKRCLIPPLLLQPLLENAVSHGIASMADGGWIRLEARVADGTLGIIVENERDDEAPRRLRSGGLGLKNVRSRLEARYGKDATFSIEPGEDRFRVSMSLPAEYGESK